jgi:hypothetical protein
MRAVRSRRAIADVAGIDYQTDAVQGSHEEAALLDMQAELADGVRLIGHVDPRPQLFLAAQAAVGGGDGPSVIGLWVPVDKQARAEELLLAAGCTLSGQA